ncbi:GNAT family N-acetyltransferase [Bacillus sp. SG-1]|uniref:GNAT family N-acetyltransferase n=1 Tax=Bacillus sp. SG-1 TaxID=161544 RepID=UPI0005C62A92|nr:GNAT family N-acetyltransferase [Bacillus sp. SG-1]
MKIIQQWHQKDSDFIKKKVIEHNMSHISDSVKTPLRNESFIVKNENEEIVGGITATLFWGHCHIDFLWVDNKYRAQGYGVELLAKMENLAKETGCYLIILDTFSFQAPEFYKKQGYNVIGIVEDFPKGNQQYYLEKRLKV